MPPLAERQLANVDRPLEKTVEGETGAPIPAAPRKSRWETPGSEEKGRCRTDMIFKLTAQTK